MSKGAGEISITAPGRLAWIFGSSRSGSTWLLRMLSQLDRVVPIDDPHLGHHLGVWRPIPLAWATSKESPKLGTLADFKRQKRDYLFSDHYREHWMPALRDLIEARYEAQAAEDIRDARDRGPDRRRQGARLACRRHPDRSLPRLLPDLPAPRRPRRRRLLARCVQRRQLGDRGGGLPALGRGPDGADPLAIERLASPHRGGPGDLRPPSPPPAADDPLRGAPPRPGPLARRHLPGARDRRLRGGARGDRERQLLREGAGPGEGIGAGDQARRAGRLGADDVGRGDRSDARDPRREAHRARLPDAGGRPVAPQNGGRPSPPSAGAETPA